MKEKLEETLQTVQEELKKTKGWVLSEPTAGMLKQAASYVQGLARTEEGIFDLETVGEDSWKAAYLVYPVCAYYETICNKKEGYPDLLEQIRIKHKKLNDDFTYAHAAAFLKMLIDTIQGVSEEVYEYYRELIDLFRGTVRRVLEEYPSEATTGTGEDETDRLFHNAIGKACEMDVLLKEKYQKY